MHQLRVVLSSTGMGMASSAASDFSETKQPNSFVSMPNRSRTTPRPCIMSFTINDSHNGHPVQIFLGKYSISCFTVQRGASREVSSTFQNHSACIAADCFAGATPHQNQCLRALLWVEIHAEQSGAICYGSIAVGFQCQELCCFQRRGLPHKGKMIGCFHTVPTITPLSNHQTSKGKLCTEGKPSKYIVQHISLLCLLVGLSSTACLHRSLTSKIEIDFADLSHSAFSTRFDDIHVLIGVLFCLQG